MPNNIAAKHFEKVQDEVRNIKDQIEQLQATLRKKERELFTAYAALPCEEKSLDKLPHSTV